MKFGPKGLPLLNSDRGFGAKKLGHTCKHTNSDIHVNIRSVLVLISKLGQGEGN